MAESKHTPGPWFCELALGDDIGPAGTRYWTIKPTTFYNDERFMDISSWISDENARLIAAAPDMLAALEGVYARFCGEYPDHPETVAVAIAIAKAKGTAND